MSLIFSPSLARSVITDRLRLLTSVLLSLLHACRNPRDHRRLRTFGATEACGNRWWLPAPVTDQVDQASSITSGAGTAQAHQTQDMTPLTRHGLWVLPSSHSSHSEARPCAHVDVLHLLADLRAAIHTAQCDSSLHRHSGTRAHGTFSKINGHPRRTAVAVVLW